MVRTRTFLIVVLALGAVTVGFTGDNWPHWRGPTHNGVSDETDLPLHWNAEENIAWKLDLPGRSGATPIIWGDRVFVNVSNGDSIELWCVDRKTGDVMWKKILGGGNRRIRKHNHATPSPVTDGESLWHSEWPHGQPKIIKNAIDIPGHRALEDQLLGLHASLV